MSSKKICWISWDKLTQPKSMGGLGFRDIQSFNQALLAKIGWRILTKPDSLLARILLGKYCNKTSFLKVQAASNISHGWRGILLGRDILLNHLGKAIGDGESTSVWNDSWIKPEANLKPFGPLTLQDRDLMVLDLLTIETREWNIAKVEELLPELKSHFLYLRPSILGARDSFIWPLQNSGTYTVKTGYNAIQAAKNHWTDNVGARGSNLWNKLIWSTSLSPKLKLFLWKVGNNALPTGENLQTRGMLSNTMCTRIGDSESIAHILFHCPFAKEVWELGPWEHSLDTSTQNSFFEKLQFSKHQSPLPPYGLTGNAFPWICWTLWTLRNQLLFENRSQSATEVFSKALVSLKEWEAAQPTTQESKQKDSPRCHALTENSMEISCNTDASWKGGIQSAGLAWIFAGVEGTAQRIMRSRLCLLALYG